MKKKTILTTLGITAGIAAAAFYLVKRYRNQKEVQAWNTEDITGLQRDFVQPSRHITNVFAKAKQHN